MSFPRSEFSRNGEYIVKRILARGGQGIVYLGQETKMGHRLVAIKEPSRLVVTTGNTLNTPGIVQRLEKEKDFLAVTSHENILTIHNVLESKEGETAGEIYLILEYIEGGSAKSQKENDRPFSVSEICKIGIHVCKALDKVHRYDHIHRDIKPGNILLDLNHDESINRAVLADFGIVMDIDSTENRFGQHLSTERYAAPEQLRGEKINRQADFYALGASLWSLLVKDVHHEYYDLKQDGQQLDICRYRSDVNSKLAAVLSKALSENWQKRYENAEEFRKALEAAKVDYQPNDSHAVTVRQPQGQKPQGQKPQGQKPQGQKPQGQKPQGQSTSLRKNLEPHQSREKSETNWRVIGEIGALLIASICGLVAIDPTTFLATEVVLGIMIVGAFVGFARCILAPRWVTFSLFFLLLFAAFVLVPLGARGLSTWLLQTAFWLALLLPLATLIPQ